MKKAFKLQAVKLEDDSILGKIMERFSLQILLNKNCQECLLPIVELRQVNDMNFLLPMEQASDGENFICSIHGHLVHEDGDDTFIPCRIGGNILLFIREKVEDRSPLPDMIPIVYMESFTKGGNIFTILVA